MTEQTGRKNKLFKGLTEYDILVWEEEKMRHQRKVGKKITDVEFLRYLLIAASRPVVSAKQGVASAFLVKQGPIYEKAESFLEKYCPQVGPKSAMEEERARGTSEPPHPDSPTKKEVGAPDAPRSG